MNRRWRRGLRAALGAGSKLAAALLALVLLVLAIAVAREPLPEALRSGASLASTQVFDRDGRLLGEVRGADGARAAAVRLKEVPPSLVQALLAAEDARFFSHPGVDPLAVARAVGQLIAHQHIVSGASTITQQLARNLVPRPRTLLGKWRELVVALRLELELEKEQILEEYLNRVAFGPQVFGVEAASRLYFDKPVRQVDWAEAATLAALPQAPTAYDPRRGSERLRQRRDWILGRLIASGHPERVSLEAARARPIEVRSSSSSGSAFHLVSALARGGLAAELPPGTYPRIETTIDAGLQRELEALAKSTRERLRAHDGSAAAALIVDNGSGEVLAYVGSPDFFSTEGLGQNDGVRALRQPGSTLKPFVYAAAMERLGLTAASLLPDLALSFPTSGGVFTPRNYDGRYHGPVRLREALGSSLNVPAVQVTSRLGAAELLGALHEWGFESLDRDAGFYGVALALGDGEVRLLELAAAYAALARGGEYLPLRFVSRYRPSAGALVEAPRAAPRRVLARDRAAVITDILSDPAARASGFGPSSVLDLPFPVAVKTGTSKGYRDNWTIGYTREVTVAVWVGNFDGHPLLGSSGITGAAPLFREAMLAAMRDRSPAPLVEQTLLTTAPICPLSGQLPGPDCPHQLRERFVRGSLPHERCTMHRRVSVDRDTGELATPSSRRRESRVLEWYPDEYVAWAIESQRPLVPGAAADAQRTPYGHSVRVSSGRPMITFPAQQARFSRDPGVPSEQQRIVLQARAPADAGPLTFRLDGAILGRAGAPFQVPWQLQPGRHELVVSAADGSASAPVHFFVD